jgi:hypothetical protein
MHTVSDIGGRKEIPVRLTVEELAVIREVIVVCALLFHKIFQQCIEAIQIIVFTSCAPY